MTMFDHLTSAGQRIFVCAVAALMIALATGLAAAVLA